MSHTDYDTPDKYTETQLLWASTKQLLVYAVQELNEIHKHLEQIKHILEQSTKVKK